jgi:hypothetical protein
MCTNRSGRRLRSLLWRRSNTIGKGVGPHETAGRVGDVYWEGLTPEVPVEPPVCAVAVLAEPRSLPNSMFAGQDRSGSLGVD